MRSRELSRSLTAATFPIFSVISFYREIKKKLNKKYIPPDGRRIVQSGGIEKNENTKQNYRTQNGTGFCG